MSRPGARRPGGPRAGAGPGRFQVEVLYEDEDLIVVDKPAGLPTMAPEGSRTRSLLDAVSAIIRRRNPKGRAALVHRLDRDTSGVIAFAKHARAKASLMARWNDAVDERVYLALAEGEPAEAEGTLVHWLDGSDPYRVRIAAAGTRGALRAVTRYRVVEQGKGYALVELSLETGRRHQIRVQLAAMGWPIAGDERYGARSDPAGRLCLHAARLAIHRPSDGQLVDVSSPAPACFGEALRRGAYRLGAPERPGRTGRSDGSPSPGRTTGPRKSPSSYSTRRRQRP